MPSAWAERILLLCCGQILARYDRSLLAVSLCELARRLEVDRETGRRHRDAIQQAALTAIEARRPGRPRRDIPADVDRRAAALEILIQMLVYLLRQLVGETWHQRLPTAMRVRLGAWVCQLRTTYSLGLRAIADYLQVGRKVVQRWEAVAQAALREPARVDPPAPDQEQAWALIRAWYLALRQLPVHRRLSTRGFVAIFNRAFAEPLAELGVRRVRRAQASRIERGAQVGRLDQRRHPRGSFRYPAPFQQLAIDTTYVDVGPHRLYLIVLMDVGARVVLAQEIFLADNTEAVLAVLEQTAERFGVGEFLLIDRGTPYLNDRVERWLRSRGVRRIVCRRATPTEKACLERYNRTFKDWLRPHLEDLRIAELDLDRVLTAMQLASRILWQAYNVRPQPFIDGLSPIERLEQHPLAAIARERVELVRRSIDSAPRRELIAHVRQLLQLGIGDAELADRLAGYAEDGIRDAARQCEKRFHRGGIRDPLGYFLARVRDIDEQRRLARARRQADKERARLHIARDQALQARREAERAYETACPEGAAWAWIVWLLHALRSSNRYLERLARAKVRRLLADTRNKLGEHLFQVELDRIAERLAHLRFIVPPGQISPPVPLEIRTREQAQVIINHAARSALREAG